MENMPKLPIFLCYRQADGSEVAKHVYNLLNKSTVSTIVLETGEIQKHQLDVYYDQTSAVQDDWTKIHEPYLKRARALILICTPGAFIDEGPQDWVYKELGWWLKSNRNSPILIDALGSESRYIPKPIAQRWPNAQRIKLIPGEWESLSSDELINEKRRVKERMLSGIATEGQNWLKQELDIQIELTRKLQTRFRWAFAGLSLATIFAIFAYHQFNEALMQRNEAVTAINNIDNLIDRINFGNTDPNGIQSMQRLCNEAIAVTAELAYSKSYESNITDRFWQLYYGEMNLIELREMTQNGNSNTRESTYSDIDRAMRYFGDSLKASLSIDSISIPSGNYTAYNPNLPDLEAPATKLEEACLNFIDRLTQS